MKSAQLIQLALLKQAGIWDMGKSILNEGSYFLPGVGTARMGLDAINSFRSGNWLGGLSNIAGAGLSLVGLGGLGRGLGAAGRFGGKQLGRLGMPALAQKVESGLGKTLPGLIDKADAKVMQTGKSLLQKTEKLPVVGKPIAGAGNTTARFMRRHPVASGVGVTGAEVGGDMLQAGHQAQQASSAGLMHTANWLRYLREQGMVNPMYVSG